MVPSVPVSVLVNCIYAPTLLPNCHFTLEKNSLILMNNHLFLYVAATELVTRSIRVMMESGCEEVVTAAFLFCYPFLSVSFDLESYFRHYLTGWP